MLREVQFDGLPGPTHHFAGLAVGNLASQSHAGFLSHPRAAARQGLAKMRKIVALGVPQAFLPPLMRPDLDYLRSRGFSGSDAEVIAAAARSDFRQLQIASSSAFMWTANCATVAPLGDGTDGIARVLVANLVATPHRALEGAARAEQLKKIFVRVPELSVLAPLPIELPDEGAANHTRLQVGANTCHLFVYGRAADLAAADLPKKFPARQTREASREVARLLGLASDRVVLARQHPQAIDAGAFHNDVVMVGDHDRVLVHEQAWCDQAAVLAELRKRLPDLRIAVISAGDLSLEESVASYLFNSQLLKTATGIVLVAPAQAAQGRASAVVERLLAEGFVDRVEFVDLGQSMANGGGPACLRLRVQLTDPQIAKLPADIVLDEAKIARLEAWVDRHYRVELRRDDLADPALVAEGRAALEDLATIVGF